MSANRPATLVVFVLALLASGFAQVNEISATVGRTFVSSQTIKGAAFFNPNVHFGAEETIGLNYSRLLKNFHGVGLRAELPFAYVIDMDLNAGTNVVPENYRAFYLTPALRANFFQSSAVSPWLSFGGGYARYKSAGHTVFGGPNPGNTISNSGVLQFGAGLDVWPWQRWGFRLEARDYNSGMPKLNVNVGRTRQNNYYVGGGVIRRF